MIAGGLPDGYRARPIAPGDLDAIAALWRSSEVAMSVDPSPTREYLQWVWGLPFVQTELDTIVVSDGGDAVVGYAQVYWDPAQGGPIYGDGVVHPAHRGRGIGTALIRFMESRRDARSTDIVRVSILAADDAAHRLLDARRYEQVRTAWDMRRALEGGSPPPSPPTGVAIRTFEPDRDERTLYEVSESAFEDHWSFLPRPYESFAADFYDAHDWDPTLVFLAETDGETVGELIAVEFEASGYIASLGVIRAFRGRGIAKALLRHAFAEIAGRGHREVGLSVDAANPTGAVAVYEAVGMTVQREFHVFDGRAS